ncbi:MAG TPA: S1 RNA-binding domain-containing protein [Terriglobales bacterium]|jgi:small subunit ribosomal protein S1|nr:S1 RNA-binding domain-containing protein [Terriglobales bacterium]
MSNPNSSDPNATVTNEPNVGATESAPADSSPTESFKDIFSEYEQSHRRKAEPGSQRREGTVIAITADSIVLDIGLKTEGVLPLTAFPAEKPPKPGDKLQVTIKGRDPEGYYELTRGKVERPTDWASLEKAFAEKSTIIGTVTGVVKGGVSVDVGVRAFMPASRSGTHDAAELEKLVEQEIRCRIIKIDVDDEDVVVDRRAIAEDEERAGKERRFSELKEGDVVQGEIRSLTDYGAFVDIGGADALLHVGEISWHRVGKPADVLTVGQQIEARIIKIDDEKHRIAISMKQLQPHPWDAVAGKYAAGERVRGTVSRIADFGAFVEIEPGIEGLIHISEMSWAKRVRTPSDIVKVGDTVEAVILGVNAAERRISLGLKQALGDPWAGADQKFAPGTVIEGPVTSLTKFGAFVQLTEGVEGMIHISEISAEKRINHPQEVLRSGQVVKAQVLALDTEKRLIRLSIKQLVPTGLDEYLAEHKEGDVVTGRFIEVSGGRARVELGEGVEATCRIPVENSAKKETEATPASSTKPDLSSLGSMLQARWKSGAPTGEGKPEAMRAGQIREFRIAKLDAAAKKIEVELS